MTHGVWGQGAFMGVLPGNDATAPGINMMDTTTLWGQQPIGGQACQLWANERTDPLYLHSGVECQISRDLEPALTMREFCENPQKSCDTRTLTLIVLEQEGAVCQSCEGPDDNDVMVIRGCLIMMVIWCNWVAFCLKWSAERKWNEISNEHPAVQHRCRQILNAVSQHICKFETDICIGKLELLFMNSRSTHMSVGSQLKFCPIYGILWDSAPTLLLVSHCHMSAVLLLLLKYFSRYTKIFHGPQSRQLGLYWDTSRVKFTIYCGNSSDTSSIKTSAKVTNCLQSSKK